MRKDYGKNYHLDIMVDGELKVCKLKKDAHDGLLTINVTVIIDSKIYGRKEDGTERFHKGIRSDKARE